VQITVERSGKMYRSHLQHLNMIFKRRCAENNVAYKEIHKKLHEKHPIVQIPVTCLPSQTLGNKWYGMVWYTKV